MEQSYTQWPMKNGTRCQGDVKQDGRQELHQLLTCKKLWQSTRDQTTVCGWTHGLLKRRPNQSKTNIAVLVTTVEHLSCRAELQVLLAPKKGDEVSTRSKTTRKITAPSNTTCKKTSMTKLKWSNNYVCSWTHGFLRGRPNQSSTNIALS